jgi:hypothetical protein
LPRNFRRIMMDILEYGAQEWEKCILSDVKEQPG